MFIAIEGVDGSGKTTVIKKVLEKLNDDSLVYTREPGGVEISEKIRNIILDNNNQNLDPKTEALLFAAARRQHLVEKIIPALNNHKHVICDRYLHSSLAYQGYGRMLGIDNIYNINSFAIDMYTPDIVIWFKLDPVIGLERTKGRDTLDRMDQHDLEFYNLVAEGYEFSLKKSKYAKGFELIEIDASEPLDVVVDKVYNILREKVIK